MLKARAGNLACVYVTVDVIGAHLMKLYSSMLACVQLNALEHCQVALGSHVPVKTVGRPIDIRIDQNRVS
jgi:hypothetical protein